jgi:hypothetical protein
VPRRSVARSRRSGGFARALTSNKPDRTGDDASDYKVMLDLMAHEATWLSVSSDGKPVFSGILQANQTKTVGGKESAKMRVGNAAGIEVRLNGNCSAAGCARAGIDGAVHARQLSRFSPA